MEQDSGQLRVPVNGTPIPGHGAPTGAPTHGHEDTLSLRSAHRRLELLHDVVSIRSHTSRHTRRSRTTGNRSVQLPPRRTLWRRFKDAFRTVIAFVFSNVGICVLVLVYLILGET